MKKVLVTGASGNLGKSVCDFFIEKNYFVIALVSPGSELSLKENINCSYYSVDLSDEHAVGTLYQKIEASHGVADAGIFLAGGYEAGELSATTGENLDKMFNLNFKTAYFISQQLFGAMMKRKQGRLCFVGAKPGVPGNLIAGSTAYALSKSLLFKLAEIYNAEGKKSNVTASVFVPSVIDTPDNRKSMQGADFSKWVEPVKIAAAMEFFCSENGSAIREGVFKLYGES